MTGIALLYNTISMSDYGPSDAILSMSVDIYLHLINISFSQIISQHVNYSLYCLFSSSNRRHLSQLSIAIIMHLVSPVLFASAILFSVVSLFENVDALSVFASKDRRSAFTQHASIITSRKCDHLSQLWWIHSKATQTMMSPTTQCFLKMSWSMSFKRH